MEVSFTLHKIIGDLPTKIRHFGYLSTFVQFEVAVIVCNGETDVFHAVAQRRGSPGRV